MPERDLLAAALEDARDGRSRVVQIVAEAGVGKTALARSLTDFAADTATSVAWVRCVGDTGAPPYHPWMQVLRSALSRVDPKLLLQHRPDALQWLTHLDPSLQRSLDAGAAEVPIPSGLDPAQARFALFEAVAAVLSASAQHDPVLVVLDDIHNADAASVLLLRFLARALSDARLLIVTTGRRELSELADDSDVMPLRGLSAAEITSLFKERTGVAPAAEDAEALYRATAGNPLFLEQIIANGSESVPEALGDMLRRRLTRMPPDAATVLTACAVVEGFPAVVVRDVSGLDAPAFIAAVDTAVAGGLLVDGGGVLHQFSHPLIREALYTSLERSERRKWHLRAAEALERLHFETDTGRRDVGRAHHRREALPLGDPAKAVEATLQTAAQADQTMAFEDAATALRACLKALDRIPMELPAERARLLGALARTLSRGRQRDDARESAREAAAAARHAQSPVLLAEAALAMPRGAHFLQPDPELRDLLEEALHALARDDLSERVRLLARLAQEFPTDAVEDLRRVANDATATAAGVQDPALTALANKARQQALWVATDAQEERLVSATEMMALAREEHDIELELDGHMWRMIALLELGRIGEAESEMLAYRRLAEDIGHSLFLMFARSREATFALLHGRVADGERLAREAHSLARKCGSPEADAMLGTALLELHFERRCDDMVALEIEHVRRVGLSSFISALGLERLGRLDEARAALRAGVEQELAGGPAFQRLAALAAGARAAWMLDDADAARPLYEALAPYANLHVVLGGAVSYLGPATRYLGLCAAASDRDDAAVSHLQSALEDCERAAALPLVARISLELATVLGSGAPDGGSVRARTQAGRALDLGRMLGMDRVVEESEELLSRLTTAPHHANSLRRQGDLWTLSAGGTIATLKHARGLEQLARLLSAPHQDISALDLLNGIATTRPSSRHVVLDDKAKAAYRRRLVELDEELAAAAKGGDVRREKDADAERAALLLELRRAVGLGGRDRLLGSQAERARVNVTRTLRHALDQIVEVAPDVGAHLLRSIRTGTYCSYRPAAGEEVDWSV
jgi:hypothetical protein